MHIKISAQCTRAMSLSARNILKHFFTCSFVLVSSRSLSIYSLSSFVPLFFLLLLSLARLIFFRRRWRVMGSFFIGRTARWRRVRAPASSGRTIHDSEEEKRKEKEPAGKQHSALSTQRFLSAFLLSLFRFTFDHLLFLK